MATDGVLNRGGRAVVHKRPSKAEAPEARCTDLLGRGDALCDAIAGADIVQQQIGKHWDQAAVEEGIGARPCLTTTSMAPRPGGASSFMKLSKLSMPRRPVPGSRRSSGSGIGSQTRMRSGGMPTARPTRLSPEAASVRTAARPLTPSRFCVWGRAGGKPTRGVAEGIFGQLLPPLREL